MFSDIRSTKIVMTLAFVLGASGCGIKRDYEKGQELEPAVLGGNGASRTQTTTQTQTKPRPQKPKPSYNIVPVTQIIEATSGISGWLQADLPFTGAPVNIGQLVTDGQTPFQFDFPYPQNNYQFIEAHLVIDTQRDNSDTEGIFVDGVFSGRPPLNNVSASAKITDKIYMGNNDGSTVNSYFIDWSVAHYKIATRNTFDLLLSDLLTGTTKTSIDVLKDNQLNVVTGDDSPVFQAYLVIRGRTISGSTLSCVNSDTFTFTNQYLHNDGNTVGQSAFSGSVTNAYTSYRAAIGTYAATEFYYDPALPKVDVANINVTTADLLLKVKRSNTGAAAIVINGIGISQTGFDRSMATSAVETWDDGATAAWESFLATIPTNQTATTATLNLINLLGATKVRDLLAQGKVNISLAGNIIADSTKVTSARGLGSPADGPELRLNGTYFTEVCTVPDDPTSPLTQDGIVDNGGGGDTGGTDTIVTNDGIGPEISSLQATEITSTSATILWLTDEPSTAKVKYGIGGLTTETPKDTNLTTYHQVHLTNLMPYKYYNFQIVTEDKFGNETTSDIIVFVTLR